MTQTQFISLEYLAGFIDGEGSIYFSKQNPDKTHKNMSVSPRLVLTGSHYPLLVLISDQYGLGKVMRAKIAKNRIVYHIRCASPKIIVPFLELILPHLVIKKEQAELMLRFFREREITTIASKGKQGFTPLAQEEIEKRKFFFLKMKELNHQLLPPLVFDSSSNIIASNA